MRRSCEAQTFEFRVWDLSVIEGTPRPEFSSTVWHARRVSTAHRLGPQGVGGSRSLGKGVARTTNARVAFLSKKGHADRARQGLAWMKIDCDLPDCQQNRDECDRTEPLNEFQVLSFSTQVLFVAGKPTGLYVSWHPARAPPSKGWDKYPLQVGCERLARSATMR